MKIFLIRHCATEDQIAGIGNTDDSHIAKTFRAKEIQDLQKLCKNVDKVYCSPLIRAKETAELIMKSLNLDIPLILLEELHWPNNAKDKQSVKKLLKELDVNQLSPIQALLKLCEPALLRLRWRHRRQHHVGG